MPTNRAIIKLILSTTLVCFSCSLFAQKKNSLDDIGKQLEKAFNAGDLALLQPVTLNLEEFYSFYKFEYPNWTDSAVIRSSFYKDRQHFLEKAKEYFHDGLFDLYDKSGENFKYLDCSFRLILTPLSDIKKAEVTFYLKRDTTVFCVYGTCYRINGNWSVLSYALVEYNKADFLPRYKSYVERFNKWRRHAKDKIIDFPFETARLLWDNLFTTNVDPVNKLQLDPEFYRKLLINNKRPDSAQGKLSWDILFKDTSVTLDKRLVLTPKEYSDYYKESYSAHEGFDPNFNYVFYLVTLKTALKRVRDSLKLHSDINTAFDSSTVRGSSGNIIYHEADLGRNSRVNIHYIIWPIKPGKAFKYIVTGSVFVRSYRSKKLKLYAIGSFTKLTPEDTDWWDVER